jgi:hypothetical protein
MTPKTCDAPLAKGLKHPKIDAGIFFAHHTGRRHPGLLRKAMFKRTSARDKGEAMS